MNLEAVYPNPNDPTEELSIEEVRAAHRGWLHRQWAAIDEVLGDSSIADDDGLESTAADDSVFVEGSGEEQTEDNAAHDAGQGFVEEEFSPRIRTGRGKKFSFVEVKGETQTSR